MDYDWYHLCFVLQAVLTTQFNGFKIQLGDVLSHQLADALSTERTKTDAAIAQVLQSPHLCHVLDSYLPV